MRVPSIASLLILAVVPACLDEPSPDASLGEATHDVILERNATVAAGHQHSCAIAPDATVTCWGRNTYGQLGDGTTTDAPLGVTVAGVTGAVAVTAGKYHSCAALVDGSARCWGLGTSGQLGDGASLTRLTPVVVSGLGGVTSIAAGGAHTCATLSSGQARCWGSNTYGQLGTNSTTSAATPRAVLYRATPTSTIVNLAGASEIETGASATCARMSSGAVACWGRNNYGQLGDGTTTNRSLPVAASGISTAVDVAVGDNHACAVTSNTRVRCWGMNLMGQLGDGTQTARSTPVEMRRAVSRTLTYPIVNVTSAAAGQYHTCVRSAGETWCVGNNDAGQLGRPVTPYLELLAVSTDPMLTATEVAAGGEHTCLRRPNGTVRCFGADTYGQVGNFGGCPILPTASIAGVAAPGGRLLAKGPSASRVHYVQGNRLELTLVTTACADVSRVVFRGTAVAPDDPVEPSDGVGYAVTSRRELPNGDWELVLGLDFVNYANGTSSTLAVDLASPVGTTATAAITVAEVLEADPAHNGQLEISKQELINEVLQAMYGKFGDQNYWARNGVNFYGFDYANFHLFAGTDGLSFVATAKADLLDTDVPVGGCDPTITVSGRFRVVLQGATIGTEWVEGPDASADYPFYCSLPSGMLLDFVTAIVAEIKDNKVRDKIDKRIAELGEVCTTPATGSCDALVQSITHEPDSIRITINRLFDSVAFRQPYVSSQFTPPPPGVTPSRGVAIPAGEPVLAVVGGMAMSAGLESSTVGDYHIGAGGLFNWNWDALRVAPPDDQPWGPHPPILDPWPCDVESGACGYLPGRHGPWLRQRGLRRTLTELPMPDQNVGSVVARRFDVDGASPMYGLGGRPCGVPAATSQARLVLGRNDRSGGPLSGEYGSGDAVVSLVFTGFDLGLDCPTE
ncbi:MAG: hypothetical protein JNK64_02315 [Myxococcales bacterium]|nr:hypothetical protein [Myxococcales bacterium]